MESTHALPLIPIGEAARRLGISVDTLRRWSDDGTIEAVVLPSGHRRYSLADVEALIASRRASA